MQHYAIMIQTDVESFLWKVYGTLEPGSYSGLTSAMKEFNRLKDTKKAEQAKNIIAKEQGVSSKPLVGISLTLLNGPKRTLLEEWNFTLTE